MLKKLLESRPDLAALILRIGLAAIFIVHGYIKVYVPYELVPKAMNMTTQSVVGGIELIGGLMLLVGLFSRIAALAIIPLQLGAIFLISGRHAMEGPMLNVWGADYLRVGPEYNLVLIAMCLGVMVLGSGVGSLDHLIGMWRRKKAAAPVTAHKGSVPAEAKATVPQG